MKISRLPSLMLAILGIKGIASFLAGIFILRTSEEQFSAGYSAGVSLLVRKFTSYRLQMSMLRMKSIEPSVKTGAIIKIGKAAVIFGVLILAYGFFMDISVETGYGSRVVNLGLISQRQSTLILGGIALLCGIILQFRGRIGEADKPKDLPNVKDEHKKCPFCAEYIKAEAVLCRHCKSDLTGEK